MITNRGVEAHKMDSFRVYMPVVVDLHHVDEE
jgi:hypothetical protein